MVMTQTLMDEYQSRFDNADTITHPAIMGTNRFAELVQGAITSGKPITREQLDAEFGELPWDEE